MCFQAPAQSSVGTQDDPIMKTHQTSPRSTTRPLAYIHTQWTQTKIHYIFISLFRINANKLLRSKKEEIRPLSCHRFRTWDRQ